MHFIQVKENNKKSYNVLMGVMFRGVKSYAVLKLKVFPA